MRTSAETGKSAFDERTRRETETVLSTDGMRSSEHRNCFPPVNENLPRQGERVGEEGSTLWLCRLDSLRQWDGMHCRERCNQRTRDMAVTLNMGKRGRSTTYWTLGCSLRISLSGA